MATYFDRREGREKPIPDCAKHGLVWDAETQRCERKGLLDRLLGDLMAEDFYIDDYGGGYYDGGYSDVSYLANGGGGYYDSGYFSDPYIDTYDYYNFGGEGDYFSDPYLPFEPLPGEGDFYPLPMPEYETLPYIEPMPIYEPLPDLPIYSGPDLPLADIFIATDWFAELPESDVYQKDYWGQYQVVPDLPPALPYTPIPYAGPYVPTYWTEFPEGPYYELPPPPKQGPCDTLTGLPGACAGGFYHPLDNPCACVPFPPAPPPQQQPKPPAQQSPQQAPKPPAQQQQQQQACPANYCKHPTTGQCIPIPQGYYRHQQTQVCTALPAGSQTACPTGYCRHPQSGQCIPTPQGYGADPWTQICTAQTAQAAPLPPPEGEANILDELGKLPWWLWAVAGGVLLIGSDRGGGSTTTIKRGKR